MTTPVPVTIIVLTKNSLRRHLRDCVRGLFIQTHRPLNAIFIDAGSTDGTTRYLDELHMPYPHNTIPVPPSFTIGAARTLGAWATPSEFLAYIDSDVELPHSQWIDHMLEPFKDPNVAGVQTLAKTQPWDPWILRRIHNSFEYPRTVIDKMHPQPVGTSHLLLRRGLVLKYGAFPDISFGEDTAITNKLMKAGYKFIYLPQEKCYHYHVDNIMGYLRKQARNRITTWRQKA